MLIQELNILVEKKLVFDIDGIGAPDGVAPQDFAKTQGS